MAAKTRARQVRCAFLDVRSCGVVRSVDGLEKERTVRALHMLCTWGVPFSSSFDTGWMKGQQTCDRQWTIVCFVPCMLRNCFPLIRAVSDTLIQELVLAGEPGRGENGRR